MIHSPNVTLYQVYQVYQVPLKWIEDLVFNVILFQVYQVCQVYHASL